MRCHDYLRIYGCRLSPHQGHQGTTAPLRARLDISRRHKNPCRCGLVLPQESVRWMVEWVNGLWFQWTKWIYVSFQYISFISMEFNGLMLWPWRHGNGHRPIVLPTAEAELCRQRDATKAWRSCAAEGSCSIAQQRQQALRRGCPWEKPGEKRCGYLICYLPLFGKKSGGFGNVNGYEEYATWFNEFNVVLFPFWWEHELKKAVCRTWTCLQSLSFAIEKSSSRRPKSPGKVSHRGCVALHFGILPPIKTEQVWKDEWSARLGGFTYNTENC